MKIIRFHALPSAALPVPPFSLHADSSLLLPGRPLFMPEEQAAWVARPHVAVRIGRLGKNIALRFLPRYRDAISLALHITTADASSVAPALVALRDLSDASIVLGSWSDTISSSIVIADTPADLSPILSVVDPLIAAISERTTLKTGDIFLFPIPDRSIPLAPGHIEIPPAISLKVV